MTLSSRNPDCGTDERRLLPALAKRIVGRLALVAVVALTAVRSEAGTVYWDMQTASPTSNGIAATIGDITQGNTSTTTLLGTTSASSGYSFDLNGVTESASGSNNAGVSARSGGLNTADGGSTFFEFTFTPTAGDLSVTVLGFGSRSTLTGPLAWSLRSDADSYAADLATGALANDSVWAYRTVTLGTPLDVSNGVTRTFRLFGYGGSSTASNWRIDDLQVVAVPEPSTLGLAAAGVGLAGLGACKRRRAFPAVQAV
jgi:hypothetical protein